ncbi:HAD family hydrolase [Streptomyces sp. NBC_00079]|uniref:HAD family hydrolase n=1 Tax=Streptomyces sp. NBC_00079 TaxID=2975644 RepID=UPI003244F7CE
MTSQPPYAGSMSAPELMLFDLDGVLIDSLPTMRAAWEAVTVRAGIQVPFEAYVKHLGRPFRDILRLLGLKDTEQFTKAYEDAAIGFSHLSQPFPGVEQALRDIAATGCRLGVVTSKSADRARPLVDGLDVPFAVLRAPGHGRGKPSPDSLLLALVECATDPGDALYVGDMAVDQEAALRAGMRYVHAGWGYGSPTEQLPLILEGPTQLVGLVRVNPAGPA